ncbi:MAG: arginine N-succinyltransferase [Pseudomonadota bacterium]
MRSTPPVRSADTHDTIRPEDFLIRPATPSDLSDFCELARLAGAGFTSLPANEAVLAERLQTSACAFAGALGTLMLALEDRRTRRVVGCAAVKPAGMPRPDFLNFRITDGGETLSATDRYADLTEVGSLLLHPDYRKIGIGPFLARSRYLLIATDPDRFGRHIFSELRGVVDEDDRSPFYDSVCAPHFGCSFAEADDLCAHGRQQEINALLPKAPIALETLSREALTAMGQPHRAGRRALDYLDEEGFRFEGVVDLLDGGPAVVAETRSIGTIRDSAEMPIRAGAIDDDQAIDAYLAIGSGGDFRCCHVRLSIEDGVASCSPDILSSLDLEDDVIGRLRPVDHRGSVIARDRHVPARAAAPAVEHAVT